MKPFSAWYYIKSNKSRSIIIIFMMFITTFMYIGGNFISSLFWFYDKSDEYGDKIILTECIPTDTDAVDYNSFVKDIKNDDNLIVLGRDGYGYGTGDLLIHHTLGFETGAQTYVFSSNEDMQKAFDNLGIDYDCSGLSDYGCVISKAFAANLGVKVGDLICNDTFKLEGLIDDDSFIFFFLVNSPADRHYRMMILSDKMTGKELRSYVENIRGPRKVSVVRKFTDEVYHQMSIAWIMFFLALFIVSVILAVSLNSVVTGQYIKRNPEFAIYRAIGIRKKQIKRKIASELLLMDLIAIAAGLIINLGVTYLLNEMIYIPVGKYLPYFSWIGVAGILIANVLTVIPLILLKGRRMCKMDVTEF